MDTFDVYFRRADLDRDGRISGQEAVAFFQGSNLPKHVLAQVWMHSDPKQTGFLGRTEFYNALRLVTVAQSGRELTPDIVKAALYGPAAAKIPAPQINPVTTPTAQMYSVETPGPQLRPMMPPSTQMGQMGQIGSLAPNMSQTPPLRGPQAFPNMVGNQQFFPSDSRMKPTQPTSIVSPVPLQGVSQVEGSMAGSQNLSSNLPNPSTDQVGTRASGTSAVGTVQVQGRGATPSIAHGGLGIQLSSAAPGSMHVPQMQSAATASVPPKSQELALSSFQTSKDSKSSVVSGNGFPSDSLFGGDVFSATPQAKQNMLSASSMPNSSGIASLTSGLQNTLAVPSGGNQLQPTQTMVKQNQLNNAQSGTLGINAANTSAGLPISTSSELQQPWPKMTQSDIQKYTRVFVEVDKDRDGKITGEQARNLFLSWRLPREILKQVWDLSDQDNDSMLTLREFCTALYLMERYREGRPLPPVLPNSVKFDEILLRATGQPSFTYGDPAQWANPGFSQQGIPGPRTVLSATGMRPPLQNSVSSQSNGQIQPVSQTSRAPVANFHIKEQVAMDASSQEATNVDQKVPELDKEILDSKEKIEFYRTKMQELVLYKSRCDNRLNEITERASADKREVESLGKKYEEKYKQVGEVASKLAVEEARFRDIQERKLELHNAIIKVEQGGSADGLLQVRADRIQSDLEELEKALNERCKQHGLDVKPTTTIKLPFGWQPGVQEGALDWDEDWDKFEDEGFTLTNELTVELENVTSNARPESPMSRSVFSDEVSHTNGKIEKPYGTGEQIIESGTAYAHSEEGSTWSPPGSPGRSALGTPLQEYHPAFDAHDSPHAKESSSEHLGAESTVSGDRYIDEHTWGANFDSNDDADSVWGIGSINTKESDLGRTSQNSFFGSTDFGLNPIKVDSPSAVSVDGREKRSFFDDSVPSTPLFKSGSPPGFNDRPESRPFDSYSRFDSFNMNDSGFFNQREPPTRFDSISSTTRDFDRPSFPSFDDADPFGPSGPFKTSESQSPRRDSGNWNAV